MKGYPKCLNSKEDYLYVRENFPKELWEQDFRDLLTTTSDWFFVRDLPNEASGISDATHKIVSNQQDDEEKFAQYELRDNPTGRLFALGFTVAEVQALLEA